LLGRFSLLPQFAGHRLVEASTVAACAIVACPNDFRDSPCICGEWTRCPNGMTVFGGVERRLASLAPANRLVDFLLAER
ncbi:hypothetical protein, partial [Paraburkholderia graminis]|uniref:hypothetical protein n=1 Tax=Paraburkholderia graminis TaxID=60548 RepID=UPI0038B7D582